MGLQGATADLNAVIEAQPTNAGALLRRGLLKAGEGDAQVPHSLNLNLYPDMALTANLALL